ncbi:MAG: hypothetical protein IT340_22355 [Chloroflexi bacterium]|nr:hypothetical protein [Chloroflexota bacterium]
MTAAPATRQARLRGALAADQLGARGLERTARNPACGLLKALTIAGLAPATVVAAVYGDPPREGQSPFALAAGNRFEAQLFDSGAARLLELYRGRGRLGVDECRVVSVPDAAPGTTAAAMARRRTLTARLLRLKLDGDPAAPNLIIKPRLTVGLLGLDFTIEPDALVAADGDACYTPIEVKSYPDRDGKTDAADVRSACRQAGVAVIALRAAVARLGAPVPEDLVPARGDLILRVPGAYRPTLRPMALRGEVDSLVRALAEAPRDLGELERLVAAIGPDATLDDRAVLEQLPNNYRESCREFCALASRCKERAVALGDPILLGNRAREEFAAAGSLVRVIELLEGRGAPPQTAAEQALQARLQEEYGALRRAVS